MVVVCVPWIAGPCERVLTDMMVVVVVVWLYGIAVESNQQRQWWTKACDGIDDGEVGWNEGFRAWRGEGNDLDWRNGRLYNFTEKKRTIGINTIPSFLNCVSLLLISSEVFWQ
jgi:hypothetical protein